MTRIILIFLVFEGRHGFFLYQETHQVSRAIKETFVILHGETSTKRWHDYARSRIPRIFRKFCSCIACPKGRLIVNTQRTLLAVQRAKVAITRVGSSTFHNEVSRLRSPSSYAFLFPTLATHAPPRDIISLNFSQSRA